MFVKFDKKIIFDDIIKGVQTIGNSAKHFYKFWWSGFDK